MAEIEGSGGGAVGKLWRKHGGGYYALLAIGTFVYLEIQSLAESYGESAGIRDFLESEILTTIITFGLETLLNTLLAGIWPFLWAGWMGAGPAFGWAVGGYLVWALILGWLLSRREKEFRRELGV